MSQAATHALAVDMEAVAVIELDIRGQICPSALLITLREVNGHKQALKTGVARLHVRTDNRDSTITIPEVLTNMGYAVEVTKEEGHYLITIRIRPREG